MSRLSKYTLYRAEVCNKQIYTKRLDVLIISKGKRKQQQQQQGVRERYFMVGTPREVFYE